MFSGPEVVSDILSQTARHSKPRVVPIYALAVYGDLASADL